MVAHLREYVFHVDFDELSKAIQTLEKTDGNLQLKLLELVTALRNIDTKLHQALNQEPLEVNEENMWAIYQELQKDRMTLMDMSHEWKPLRDRVKQVNNDLATLVDGLIEESVDHVTVIADTMRAHIDILEIKNSRKLSFLALIVSITISYVALWEFFAREFILNITFQGGLSPNLNYLILIISLVPMFFVLYSAWRYRKIE